MATILRYAADDIVYDTKKITTSTWSDNTNNLTSLFTSSNQVDTTDANSQGNYYWDIYNMATESISSSKEFAIAYGHIKGSGSADLTNDTGSFGYSATMYNYMQYRQLVYGDENQQFIFDTVTPDDIWVINVERKNYKHNLKTGTMNLHLTDGTSTVKLTDDSVTKSGSATLTMVGRQFNIVSGASGVMSGSSIAQTVSGSYGLFYPDAGFMILNAQALKVSLGAGATSAITNLEPSESVNIDGKNNLKLFTCISTSGHFIIDSEEKVSSQYYFTRIKNNELNYTTNPSFIDDTGTMRFSSMTDNPTVYITTVGLYGESGDLLAVAKLSKPLAKDFTKESLIRCKIDY